MASCCLPHKTARRCRGGANLGDFPLPVRGNGGQIMKKLMAGAAGLLLISSTLAEEMKGTACLTGVVEQAPGSANINWKTTGVFKHADQNLQSMNLYFECLAGTKTLTQQAAIFAWTCIGTFPDGKSIFWIGEGETERDSTETVVGGTGAFTSGSWTREKSKRIGGGGGFKWGACHNVVGNVN